jgi:hypothetical protein
LEAFVKRQTEAPKLRRKGGRQKAE